MNFISFYPAFITFQSPGEVLFKLGGIDVHWYGIFIAAGFLIALGACLYAAKQEGFDLNEIIDLSTLLLVGTIIFARLYYVIFDWDYFHAHLAEIFMLWKGGLSIHGVIIGGVIILFLYTKFKKVSLFKYTDLFACALPLGQSIGRWGNFFNSEAFGIPTTLPLRVYIPLERRPVEFLEYNYFHPTFFYESLWNLVVFFILFFVLRHKFKAINGVTTFSYLILYSAGRFIIESLRTDNIYSILNLHIAQFISLILIITGIIGLFIVFLNKRSLREKKV
ncbi:MAG TPA: prolipoprotein diacylglyceryl transferase [Candidatus Gastranaerophilales bacterium]|nr:prolipoprotein diacylglyceryl transferase [Candidatus Gastranaerophilales bacterium]